MNIRSDLIVHKLVFQQDCYDKGNGTLVVGNNNVKHVGRITNSHKEDILKDLYLRKNLKNILKDHELVRPRKK